MKKEIFIFSAIWTCITDPSPTHAQHASPSSTPFQINGPIQIAGGPVLNCFLDIQGTTRSDTGIAHSGHATGGNITVADIMSGDPSCALYSNTGTWAFDIMTHSMGTGTGQLTGLGFGICSNILPIPFSITNTGPGASEIAIDTTVGGCTVTGLLDANFNVAS